MRIGSKANRSYFRHRPGVKNPRPWSLPRGTSADDCVLRLLSLAGECSGEVIAWSLVRDVAVNDTRLALKRLVAAGKVQVRDGNEPYGSRWKNRFYRRSWAWKGAVA